MPAPPSSKSKQLRDLLESPTLEFMLEAHNGISARLVQQAGFKGIWASGLAMSAQFCVRDSNEASWTQVVDMLEFMSDATDIPILLDGDTGYGNFNNMRRLVRKLEQRGVAGVCIEDKEFPKTNSFIDSGKQALADIDEFCGKIRAGKDSQQDPDFCIVARVEALIAGWGMDEALKRASAYCAAGADAILVHSRQSRADEILAFAQAWEDGGCPLVIVPTKYYSTPVDVFRKAGISLVIWANHMIRASVRAMEQVSREIYSRESLTGVEDRITNVDSIFQLQGADELLRAQERYLNRSGESRALVLAASRGNNLYELTEDRPKAMLNIRGKPLLQRLVDEFKKRSVNDITVIAGYKSDALDVSGVDMRLNTRFETTGELYSLACARDKFSDDMVIIYGDLLFRSYILQDLLERDGEIVIVVDSLGDEFEVTGTPDYVWCDRPDDRSLFMQEVRLQRVSEKKTADDPPSGRWTGMMRVRNQGRLWLGQALDELASLPDYEQLTLPDLLNHLTQNGSPVTVHYINGHWLDVNSVNDIDRAGDFTSD